MTKEALRERLIKAGVSQDEAADISSTYDVVEPASDVDVDALTKAMEGIRDTFQGEVESSPQADVDAAVQEASDIVDAVTKGADALLVEQRSQYEALSKCILALSSEVQGLQNRVSEEGQVVKKSLAETEAALNEPMMRKSVAAADIIPAPGDETNEKSGPDLVEKALSEMQVATTSPQRQTELRKAIMLLESGAPMAEVAESYRLN